MQVIHNFARMIAKMIDPERTGHVLHQPSGDIFVTITEQDPELTTAEIKFSSPEGGSSEDFEAILDLVDAKAPKKGKLRDWLRP